MEDRPVARDGREDVERAFRLKARQAESAQAIEDHPPALIVILAHLLDVRQPALQRFDRRALRQVRCAHAGVLMHLVHRFDNLNRRCDITQPPSRHGECLGKAGEQHGALAHAGQRGEGNRSLSVGQFQVDLVGDEQQIAAAHHLGKFFQPLARQNAPVGLFG